MSTVPYTFANDTGNISLSQLDVNFANVKAFADTAGYVTAPGQANITSVGTLTSLSVSGNITGGNITISNVVVTTLSATGNITANNVVATTIVNAASHTGAIVSVTGNVTANNGMFTNIVNAASHTGAIVSVTGNVTANNGMFTNIVNVASHTGAVVSVTGNVTANNGMFTTIVNVASHTGAVVSVSGNITGGNIRTGGLVSATGNIITAGTIGIGTTTPDAELNILGSPQTVSYSLAGNSTTQGTDLHITGADGSNTRITQDAFGTGSYVAFTGRSGRGTAATPTQTQSGDTLAQFTARGFSNGTLQFGNVSTGRVDVVAAEAFTDTSRATNVVIYTTATGAIAAAASATFSSASGLSVAGNVTANNISATGTSRILSGTAAPVGGTAGAGMLMSSTANFGLFFGNGAPTLAAAQGSLYINTTASTTTTRLYINTNGSTTWTTFTTAA
jgi:hypothetical protein